PVPHDPSRHKACSADGMREYAAGIQSSELSLVDTQTHSGEEAAAPNPEQPASEGSEDRFLAKARDEYAKGHVDPSLWARAMAQAGGDKDKAAGVYLDIRATAIRVKKRQEKVARKAQVIETLSQRDPGLELPAPVSAAAASKPIRRRARANRKL